MLFQEIMKRKKNRNFFHKWIKENDLLPYENENGILYKKKERKREIVFLCITWISIWKQNGKEWKIIHCYRSNGENAEMLETILNLLTCRWNGKRFTTSLWCFSYSMYDNVAIIENMNIELSFQQRILYPVVNAMKLFQFILLLFNGIPSKTFNRIIPFFSPSIFLNLNCL